MSCLTSHKGARANPGPGLELGETAREVDALQLRVLVETAAVRFYRVREACFD
eukprot:COSAG01_NODE_24061_length_791_cov_113.962428_1_plen_53_part_00